MARRHSEPFNANPDTGRMGFRYEWEPVDSRPLVIYPYPFWESKLGEATYAAAVAGNPRCEGEGPFAYIRRLSELVTQEREAGVRSMPQARMSGREWDERKRALQRGADETGP